MTKQEEIRGVIFKFFQSTRFNIEKLHSVGTTGSFPDDMCKQMTTNLLTRLDSQGVVIEIMPPYNNRTLSKEEVHYLAIGGKLTEPLIEEVTDD